MICSLWFCFKFLLDCLKHDLIKEQSRNHELESQVKTLRHENYQMKMTKTHQKQDYVWNISLTIKLTNTQNEKNTHKHIPLYCAIIYT